MSKPFKQSKAWILILAVCLFSALFLFTPMVHADTNGTELQVAEQPEKMVIQLGTSWAGVEFELKTDAGVYPQPIVVSPEGVLTMELGGSKTYTLSAINSPTIAPSPDASATDTHPEEDNPSDETEQPNDAQQDPNEQGGETEVQEDPEETPSPDSEEDNNLINGIPNLHLFLFAGGLVACITGLVVMAIMKRRRNRQYNDYDDYDE